MSIDNPNFSQQNVNDAASKSVEYRANQGDRVVQHPDESWRPPGIICSEPLGFRETHVIALEAIDALGVRSDLWQRNGRLSRLVRPDIFNGRDGKQQSATSSLIHIDECNLSIISKFLAQSSKFWLYKGTNKTTGLHVWERVEANQKIVAMVASMASYPRSPVLRGIIQAPSMRPDGSILDTPGYDLSTGFFYQPNAEFKPVASEPTKEQLAWALAGLAEPFAAHPGYDSFPFVSDAHRWLPVALAMTLLARPAIDGCVPFFGFDATDAGTGKGMAFDVVSMIVLGTLCGKSTFPNQPEELEKVLSSHAISGSQVICFDNLSAPICGDSLDKIATTSTVDFRLLGKSEIRKLDWKSVVTFTGNQLDFRGDTVRRVVSCRQESPVESPSARSNFKYPDLLAWVKKNRVNLVCAALTVLRAYVVSGDTKSKELMKGFGSFGSWANLVPAAIHWATGVNVLDCRLSMASDPTKEAEINLFRALYTLQELRGGKGLTTKEILDAAYADEIVSYSPIRREPTFPELNEAVEELTSFAKRDQHGRPSPKTIGNMLSRRKGATRGNISLWLQQGAAGYAFWKLKEGIK